MKDGEDIHVTDGKGNLASGKLVIEGKKQGLKFRKSKKIYRHSTLSFILLLLLPRILTELSSLWKKLWKWEFRRSVLL
jgi:hypothetical protein